MSGAIQISTSIGATSTNDNVLQGQRLEFLPTAMWLEFGLNASATGLVLDVMLGDELIADQMIPLIKTTAPIYPEDFVLRAPGAPGERIRVRARNTTGGALTLLTSVRATPI